MMGRMRLGHARNARQSMDKETLLMILTLALLIGAVAMGYMAGSYNG